LTLTADTFFQKAGYFKIDRQSAPESMQTTGEFAGLCPDTAVCMKKTISS